MSKTIQINPDLFQFAKRGRKRNKTEKAEGEKIQVKPRSRGGEKSSKTIRKDLLKMIQTLDSKR
jgi:hypothetical protein